MASPTVTSLAADVAALATRMAALEAFQEQITSLAAARELRIANLEGFAKENRALIAELNESDEASGWKQWRESKKAEGK